MKRINYLLILITTLFGPIYSGFAQQFSLYSETPMQGVFYGDCAAINLNNDAYPSIIASGALSGYESGHAALYRNDSGQLSLLEQEFSSIMYSSIATGDLNGDGLEDFAIMGVKNQPDTPQVQVFEIYYNNGDGTFTKNDTTGIAAASYGSLKMADLNGDGMVDLFVNGINGNTYISKIYFQDADGNFTESNNVLTGTYFSASAIFDADGDGRPDILVTGFNTSYTPSATLYINRGAGVFEAQTSGINGVYFSSVDAKDFDGDGSMDVLVSGMNTAYTGSLTLYLNDGNGNFSPSNHSLTGTYTGASSLVDYNNDGHLDVFSIGSDPSGQNTTLFYLNDGSGNLVEDLETAALVRGLNMSKAKWFDYNNDGLLDLLTVGYTGDDGLTALYINNNQPNTEIESVAVSTVNAAEPVINTVNGSLQLLALVNPSQANQGVTWSITTGANLATVNQTGWVTAGANGTVVVRATAVADPTKFDEIEITIDAAVTEQGYCDVTVEFNIEPITLVNIAELNNATSAAIDGTPAYEDFTVMTATLEQGKTYTLTVKGNTNGNFEHDIRVFIDWNQDTVFDMHSEYHTVTLLPSNGTDNVEAVLQIAVPQNALLGQTRMRLIKDMWNVYEAGEFDACTDAYYGQIEDYTVNIVEETATVTVESVTVTTANQVEPKITIENGTLQLVARVNPAEVNQEVTWLVVQGQRFAGVGQNGLVTALANGPVIIRATSVEDTTKFAEIAVEINSTLSVDNFERTAFKFYPNPVKDILHIFSESEISEIQVFNLVGQQLVNKIESNKEVAVDLSAMPSGSYMVRIKTEGIQKTIKIIKN